MGWPLWKIQKITSVDENMEKLEPLCVSGGNVKWYSFTFPSECKHQNGTSLVAQLVENLPAMLETWVWFLGWEDLLEKGTGFDSWVGKICWRREQLPTPIFLPGEFHGQRSLAGYNPWGPKELDMAKWLPLSLFCGKQSGHFFKKWALNCHMI